MKNNDLKVLLLSSRLTSSEVAKIVGLSVVEVNRFLRDYKEKNCVTFKR